MPQQQEFEFRSANDNEMVEYQRIGSYVFAAPPQQDAPPSPIRPEWTQCAFVDGQMAAISGGYPFIVPMNGKTVPVQGVTSVGTEPRFRRRGLVRRLITDLLGRARDEGQVGSMLLASMGAIYQRFGYGLGSYGVFYRFDPRVAALQQPVEVSGECRLLGKDEALPHLREIFKDYVAGRNLTALRHGVVWDRILTQLGKGEAYCAVHFDHDGVADAYCIYTTKWIDRIDGYPPQELTITDLAWRCLDGYRAIWEFIRAHDLVGTVIWNNLPEDDPAPGLLLEPRCLNRKTLDGLWFRVVDVPALLAARGYDIDGTVTLAVSGDDLCPWNNGTWRLTVEGGEAAVAPAPGETAELECSINGLASLACGFASASWLGRVGRLSVHDPARLGQVDGLFATRYRPAMSFGF